MSSPSIFLNCRKWGSLLFCILAGYSMSLAQLDSLWQLKEVEVVAQRIVMSDVGKHTDKIDSQSLHMRQYNSLASLLGVQTPLYVRSYGYGTLATLGIRGGTAYHTQVLWNGIPLRNPMLGAVDLSLLPATLTDQVSVHYGGHGAAFGTGAVGGMLSLANDPLSLSDKFMVHLGAGSWSTWLGDVRLQYGFSELRFHTAITCQTSDNNYRYKVREGFPERNQVNSAFKTQGLLQEIRWLINQKEEITGRFWYQYADRQIPPTSVQNFSKSAQQDESYRASLQWNRIGEKVRWEIKTAWLDESIDYQDSLILLYTHNQFQTWLAEVNAAFTVGRDFSMTSGIYTERSEGFSVNYPEDLDRHQYAGFVTTAWQRPEWIWRFQMREEITDGYWSPLLVDLSAQWTGIKNMNFKSSVSRHYRVPTFNDLYWQPGGNPLLHPEEGWTAEVGLGYETNPSPFLISLQATGYARIINEWIMWMPPVAGQTNYWSPLNVSAVFSRGMETRFVTGWEKNHWKMSLNGGIDFTWSTYEESIPEFKIEEGEQVFYTPVENIQAGIRLERPGWSVHYYHHWFGDSQGINEDIEAGSVGTAGMEWRFGKRKINWMLYLQADNVWNTPYRLIERRPMPGRSFTGGLKVLF